MYDFLFVDSRVQIIHIADHACALLTYVLYQLWSCKHICFNESLDLVFKTLPQRASDIILNVLFW